MEDEYVEEDLTAGAEADVEAEDGAGGDAEEEGSYEGEELLSWTIDEYVRHERGPVWYALAITTTVAILLYAVVTQNFLFAVIVIMFAVITGLSSLREPRKLMFVVTDLGIAVGEKFFPFKDFKNFWVLYEPPQVKNVYLEFRRAALPHLVVPLDEQDPLTIRETLLRFMHEDLSKDEEPFGDLIARIFKI